MKEIFYYKDSAEDSFSLFIVEEVRQFLTKVLPRDVLFVSITGSLARGELSKYSDIDVLVVVPKKKKIEPELYLDTIDRLVGIWELTDEEFTKMLKHPLFSYYTFEHPQYIIKGFEYFEKLKEEYFTSDILSKHKEEVLQELKERVWKWSTFILPHYIEIKQGEILDAFVPDLVHDIKKFLYYLGCTKCFITEGRVPIRYKDALQYLNLPEYFYSLYEYSLTKDTIIKSYKYLFNNLGKLLEGFDIRDEVLEIFEHLKRND